MSSRERHGGPTPVSHTSDAGDTLVIDKGRLLGKTDCSLALIKSSGENPLSCATGNQACCAPGSEPCSS